MNPYQRELLVNDTLGDQKKEDELRKLINNTNFKSIKSFTLSMNRHEKKYEGREFNFPDRYDSNVSVLDYRNDPDWTVKYETAKLPVKKYVLWFLGLCLFIYLRMKDVAKFDHLKR
mmetsp:Transcript_35666/g.54575  ORF Transcript_35666/g.54575 Transcript_35666/m.54575 type:complete len:116 (-) Transcript_35666:681-1028(-)